ncbi:MAG: hypothetical protein Greene041662_956 [Candidatus Peregrinibacteria bacterium Greene0416_62]|nr:MAG: hypothetical protein Greene041662_956 [Candidatus Peregrinibacteria bacterium Greene0416_62]TSC97311.1 MAG: hypothetical protein Greene101449_1239 [Candidatus Peregrinibacteria bacterium Greene1014_49]
MLQSVSTFFARAKKVEKETRRSQVEKRLRIWREGSGKRELAPRCGSSLKQRVFSRSLRWMRDGAFPMRPSFFFLEWAPPSSRGGRGQGMEEIP